MCKTYCKGCKHHKVSGEYEFGYEHYCKLFFIKKDNPIDWFLKPVTCQEINKNNDCKDWEPNWFHRLIKKIRGKL